ncbi:MAG TPA: endonuclease/exonuclease/phosphatase family protein [Candidatus Limnocylindrales bacterium]|nr:endonuclease/exonuclease/phosphatase family protein [Candidatus Limnocylindrales bacterium]
MARSRRRFLALPILVALLLTALPAAPVGATAGTVRFATFNASLNRNNAGQALADLSVPGNAQADAVAEIIQRIRPDVLLINEFDFEPDNALAEAFQENYLGVPHNGAAPIEYPYVFVAPSNTGIPSGFDLNNNGVVGGPDDAFGFGFFPGQFGLAVFSMYPIDEDAIRTFQLFLWKDMPGALLPDDPATPAPADWYSAAELAVFRLSSKSHWDVPIDIDGKTVHFLVSHPTPPVFDGPEDRNGTRNSDEIRFWADYITPGPASAYIYDDEGGTGGLKPGEPFVIAGDQNSDPLDGDSIPGSIQQLTEHPLVNTKFTPESAGAVEATLLQGGANANHESDPRFDTADFADGAPGNLRADYVLPSKALRIVDGAVFWPVQADPLFRLTGVFPFPSSDHRAVWIDANVPG